MRIAILTLPLHTNYGGILQAYALQTVLERMGHEVVVLNRDRRLTVNIIKFPLQFLARIVRKYLLRKTDVRVFYEKYRNVERDIIEKYTSKFVDNYINCCYYKNTEDLTALDFDAIVVGSDQVWSRIHAGNICGTVVNAFLPFTQGKQIIRISYAASFGKDSWEYNKVETSLCKELVKQFNYVSVREETGIEQCKTYLGIDAECHIDPTLLLDSTDYIERFGIDNMPTSNGNLLVYFIDSSDEKAKVSQMVSFNMNLVPFIVNSHAEDMSGRHFSIEERIQPPVEQWIRGFYDADYVVTDSYHACIFSILFRKPFIAVANKERGMARFVSLLQKLDLQTRLVDTSSALSMELINQPIDWESVYSNLYYLRKQSYNYLKKAL